jgi:hypothetical protein
MENRTMEKIEVAGGAAENDADVDAEAVTEETEALREAFRKGWDKALSYRREHGTEEEAARAAAEASTDDREPSPLATIRSRARSTRGPNGRRRAKRCWPPS